MNISQISKVLSKTWRNPRYLWYFIRNVNILRDYFIVFTEEKSFEY